MSDGLATQLRAELAKLLDPLAAAASPAGVGILLSALGRPADNDAVGAELQRLAALVAGVASLDDATLASWDGLGRILDLSDELLSALRGVEGVVTDPAAAAELQGLGVELTELLTGRYLRAWHPRLHRAAAVLTLVEPAEATAPVPTVIGPDGRIIRLPWQPDRVHLERLGGLLDDPLGTLRAAYFPNDLATAADAHASADLLFPLLRELARALGLASSDGPFDPAAPPPPPPPSSDDVDIADPGGPPLAEPTDDQPAAPPVDLSPFQRTFFPRLLLDLPALPALDGSLPAPRLGLAVIASSAEHPGGVRGLLLTPTGELGFSETRGRWQLTLSADGQVPAFVIGPSGLALAPAGDPVTGAVATLTLALVPAAGSPAFRLGSATGTRLELGSAEIAVSAGIHPDAQTVELSAAASKADFVLTAGDGDGFLASVLPAGETRVDLDFGLVLSSATGLHLKGGAGLATHIPASIAIGPARVDSLTLGVSTDGGVALVATAAISVGIGPITAAIDGAGLRLGISFPADGGNLGPVQFTPAFEPPSGVGVAVDATVVAGGGFLARDPAGGRYAGALDLRVGDVDVAAIGLLDTRPAPGQGAYALVIVLSAEFPGVPVGLGFALDGVGGVLALNRRVDVDALRARLAAGTAARFLAPQDPIRNAPALIADLDAVLPLAPGVTVVGPTVKLVWAELVHVDVGVFLELPGPARVVVLGSADAELSGGDRTYVSLHVDVVGDIDLRAATAAFDAALTNSHLMGTLDLTGGAALRLSWGAQPYAVFTVGGFNPAYNPAPLVFPPTLSRVAMVHGTPSDEVYLRFEGYFAITSNTLQFGAAVEATIQSGGWSIHGSLGFDALVQFSPFHFSFDIRASVHVAYDGHSLAGLTLTGSLSGPGPVVLKAKVCIELLFFDICFSHTFQLGPTTPPPSPAAPDLLAALRPELADPARLRAAGGPDPHVKLAAAAAPLLPATGALTWEQRLAPLGLLITRLGGTPLPAAAQVVATSSAPGTAAGDWFALGQYLDLSDDEALIQPGYARLTSGLTIGAGADHDGPSAQAAVSVKQIRLPAAAPVVVGVHALPPWLLVASAPPPPVIAVGVESWSLITPAGVRSGLDEAQARRLAATTPGACAVAATQVLEALSF